MSRLTKSKFIMSLFPKDDTLAKEIESWRGFADSLPAKEDRKKFMKRLNDRYKIVNQYANKEQVTSLSP